jgi:3-oxoacyl-[acyl-carrier-protein] synthase II
MAGTTWQNPRQRVVITGLGVVSSSGMGREAFWDTVVNGRTGLSRIEGFDTSDLYCKIGGEIKHFTPKDYIENRDCLRGGRFSHFAVAAARLALREAGLENPEGRMDPFEMGAIFGTSTAGGGNISDEVYASYAEKGVRARGLGGGVQMQSHAATSHVFIEFGLRGPNTTSGVGCVSSLDSIGTACGILRSGAARVMVAGATEACMSLIVMGTLCKLGVMTSHNDPPHAACRPYDDTRDGLALSEGAGAVVLERADSALERGAPIFGEVLAYCSATEGQHLVVPDPSGKELAHAFRTALRVAKIASDEVDYICAHGIGNRQYDIAETSAAKQVLGERAYNVPMSSIKGVTGQPFAPGGLWQLTAACMTLATGIIPGTMNYKVPDPECDLDYVPNQARRARVNTVMINSHAFGGTHGCLLVRRFSE